MEVKQLLGAMWDVYTGNNVYRIYETVGGRFEISRHRADGTTEHITYADTWDLVLSTVRIKS